MNSCEYYQELISRHIDGELSEEGRAVLAEHLRVCGDCAAVYDAFVGISQAVADDLTEPPESLSINVMAEIRRENMLRQAGKEKSGKAAKAKRSEKSGIGKKQLRLLISAAACVALIAAVAFAMPLIRGGNSPALYGTESMPAGLETAQAPAENFVKASDLMNAQAQSEEAAAPAEAPAAISEEAAEAEAPVVSNVYKIEIQYAGELVEDFTMHVGEAPIRITGKIYPISISDSPNWSSSDESIVKLEVNEDGSCNVNAVGPGSALIKAEYAGKTGECWVRVAGESGATVVEGLEIHYAGTRISEFTMHPGDPNIPLKAVLPENLAGQAISWRSSDDSVIKVHDTNDGYCAVEAVGEGAAYIELDCGGNIASCRVYVVKNDKDN